MVVWRYNKKAAFSNATIMSPSLVTQLGLVVVRKSVVSVSDPNKLINDAIVGDVQVVDGTMQTSMKIFTHVDET